MEQELYRIGKELSIGKAEDMRELSDVVLTFEEVKKNSFTKNTNGKKNKITEEKVLMSDIIFDLDENTITLKEDSIEFGEESPADFYLLKTLAGNNTKMCVTVLKKNINHIKTSLINGLRTKVNKETKLNQILNKLFLNGDKIFDNWEDLVKNKFKKAHVYRTCIVSKENGISEPTPLYEIEGYVEILEKELYDIEQKKPDRGIDYITGKKESSVSFPIFKSTRYSLNKTYTSTTNNTKPDLETKNVSKGYSLSKKSVKFKEKGSDFVLKKLKFMVGAKTYCVIPKILNDEDIIITDLIEESLKSIGTLNLTNITKLITNIEDEIKNSYVLSFFEIESNGNYLKINNKIDDVNSAHIKKINDELYRVNEISRELYSYVADNEIKEFAFNMGGLYGISTDVNFPAYILNNILSRKKINEDIIYEQFVSLYLCHKYKRYGKYPHIRIYENFDYAIKDAVNYFNLLLIFLTNLNLLSDMIENKEDEEILEPKQNLDNVELSEYQKWEEGVNNFFDKMSYTNNQKSLFWLGRAINSVAYTQQQKGNRANILDKITNNKLDKEGIESLNRELVETAQKNGVLEKLTTSLNKFTANFELNNWNVTPDEALFIIITGYTFKNPKSNKKNGK